MSETRMLLWACVLFTGWAGMLYLRRRGEYGIRYPVSLLLVFVASLAGILRPGIRDGAFAVAMTGFVLFLILPGLLVGVGRWAATAGRFAVARRLVGAARLLVPARFLAAEADLYRDALAQPDGGAALAGFYRRRRATVSGTYGSRASLALAVGLGVVHLLVLTVGDTESALTLLTCGASHLPLVREGEWSRVVTAMFLHAGFLHLFFNATSIWIVGRWVEPRLGAARTILVFLIGGLVGNLVSLAVASGAAVPVPSVGASGGALALLGALIPLTLAAPRSAERNARLQAAGAIVVATAVLGLIEPVLDDGAHLGGFLTGVVLGALFTRRRLPDRLIRVAAVLGLAVVGATVVPTLRTVDRWTSEEVLEADEFTLRYPGFLDKTEVPDGWRLSRPPLCDALITRLEHTGSAPGYEADPERPGWRVYRGKILSSAGLDHEHVYRRTAPGDAFSIQLRFLFSVADERLEEAFVAPCIESFGFR